jgi:TPR repeat protein
MPETKMAACVGRLRAAADDSQPEAMFLLGIAYAEGREVERDDVMAARWFHKAARKGHVRATASMGYLYATGRGVRHEPVLGYVFLARAAGQGDPLAHDLLARLRRQLSPVQLAEAERRVREKQR